MGFIAGFLKGLIATELGKLIVPCIWNYEMIEHPSHAIGFAIVIIFTVNIVAAVTRMNPVFVGSLMDNWSGLVYLSALYFSLKYSVMFVAYFQCH